MNSQQCWHVFVSSRWQLKDGASENKLLYGTQSFNVGGTCVGSKQSLKINNKIIHVLKIALCTFLVQTTASFTEWMNRDRDLSWHSVILHHREWRLCQTHTGYNAQGDNLCRTNESHSVYCLNCTTAAALSGYTKRVFSFPPLAIPTRAAPPIELHAAHTLCPHYIARRLHEK